MNREYPGAFWHSHQSPFIKSVLVLYLGVVLYAVARVFSHHHHGPFVSAPLTPFHLKHRGDDAHTGKGSTRLYLLGLCWSAGRAMWSSKRRNETERDV